VRDSPGSPTCAGASFSVRLPSVGSRSGGNVQEVGRRRFVKVDTGHGAAGQSTSANSGPFPGRAEKNLTRCRRRSSSRREAVIDLDELNIKAPPGWGGRITRRNHGRGNARGVGRLRLTGGWVLWDGLTVPGGSDRGQW